MTRQKERKVISLACFSIIMAILTFGLIGCVTTGDIPTETKVTLSYETAGAILETALPTLQALCKAGTINAGDCAEAKEAYNEAVTIYKFLGDVAVEVIDTGNDAPYRIKAMSLLSLLARITVYTGG